MHINEASDCSSFPSYYPVVKDPHGMFDIRLKQNFKLLVSGPSRCGKTVFVSKLLENIQIFAKLPPLTILYIYKVWQDKNDEL